MRTTCCKSLATKYGSVKFVMHLGKLYENCGRRFSERHPQAG